jgi:hypothetical protein
MASLVGWAVLNKNQAGPKIASVASWADLRTFVVLDLAGVYWELGKQSPNALCCEVFSEGR